MKHINDSEKKLVYIKNYVTKGFEWSKDTNKTMWNSAKDMVNYYTWIFDGEDDAHGRSEYYTWRY